MRSTMLAAIITMAAAAVPAAALAQNLPEITVRPRGDGFGDGAYVGPYGRDLPGVQMFAGRPFGLPDSKIMLPTKTLLIDETTRRRPLGFRDSWHGTLAPGIPF